MACGALGVGLVSATIGATHLNTAARYNYPGRACLILSAMLVVSAGVTAVRLEIRRRNAHRSSIEEDARLSQGQLSTKYDRGVKLGQHLFDIDADKLPEVSDARDAWLDGRTIGPVEGPGSDEATMVGIYRAEDSLPLYGQPMEGNRHFLVIYSLAVVAVAICTLVMA